VIAILAAVAAIVVWLWAEDWRIALWAGVLVTFVVWLGVAIGRDEDEQDRCESACIAVDAPYSDRADGMCWCYRGARERFAIDIPAPVEAP
jgi:hypothetical protein